MATEAETPDRVISIDSSEPDAWLKLLIAQRYPHNRQLRDEVSLVCGADGLRTERIAALLKQAIPGSLPQAESEAWEQRIISEFLKPMGGVPALVRARSIDQIQQDMLEVWRISRLVGSVTCFAAQLHLHHRDIGGASLRRAFAILQAAYTSKSHKVPNDHSAFRQELWNEWACVAPLCAAYQVAIALRGGAGPWLAELGPIQHILSWTLWFRQWGTTCIPQRSPNNRAFIPEEVALIFETDVPVSEPPLLALRDELRAAAQFYWHSP